MFFLALIGVVLLFISYTTDFSGGPFKVAAEYVFVPMQKGLDVFGERISVNARDAATREELMAENDALKTQVEDLRTQLIAVKSREKELENLRTLLELSSDYHQYETTGAYVIGRSGGNWFDTFTINKGSNDGIEVDMNIIANGGLVGIVTGVGKSHATVRSIIDDQSSVSAMVTDTEDTCIVSGSLEWMTKSNMIELSNLEDSDNQVKAGASLVTSNISNKFVPGILIGYISELKEDGSGMTKYGKVTPVADFKHLSQVLVIKQVKESGIE